MSAIKSGQFMESPPLGVVERVIAAISRALMKDALTHPVTTAAEYAVAAGFTVIYIAGSTVPKYEEIFGLILFTSVLGFIALFVSITNPRPLMNTLVFTVLCFAGWFGCVWMLHGEYGYEIMEIPALWLGVGVSAVACILLFLANTLPRFLIGVLIR